MKYLKLFEAFSSTILSKTLNLLKGYRKEVFKTDLKEICEHYNFPVSELSDDMIMYLNYDKALSLDCEPRDTPKWIKFWFSKDGIYKGKTLTDGIFTPKENKLSQNIQDYDIVKALEEDEFFNLETGSIVLIKLSSMFKNKTCIGVFYRADIDENESETEREIRQINEQDILDQVHIIQDELEGAPLKDRNWKKFGIYSWTIIKWRDGHTTGFEGRPILLKKKNKRLTDTNTPFSVVNGIFMKLIEIGLAKDAEQIFNESDWALVLDCEKLEQSISKDLTDIRKEREEIKKDAIALYPNEEIRTANLNRYMDFLIDKLKPTMDITNYKKIVINYIGGKFMCVHICAGIVESYTRSIKRLIDLTYSHLNQFEWALSERTRKEKQQELEKEITTKVRISFEENDKIRRNIDRIKKQYPKTIPYLNRVLKINDLLYNKLAKMDFNTIEDLLIIETKINTIRFFNTRVLRAGGWAIFELNNFSECSDIFSEINNAMVCLETPENYLENSIEGYKQYLDELEKVFNSFETLIDRL